MGVADIKHNILNVPYWLFRLADTVCQNFGVKPIALSGCCVYCLILDTNYSHNYLFKKEDD